MATPLTEHAEPPTEDLLVTHPVLYTVELVVHSMAGVVLVMTTVAPDVSPAALTLYPLSPPPQVRLPLAMTAGVVLPMTAPPAMPMVLMAAAVHNLATVALPRTIV